MDLGRTSADVKCTGLTLRRVDHGDHGVDSARG
jgi:hypothetical protein